MNTILKHVDNLDNGGESQPINQRYNNTFQLSIQ